VPYASAVQKRRLPLANQVFKRGPKNELQGRKHADVGMRNYVDLQLEPKRLCR